MKNKILDYIHDVSNIVRCDVSYRGGGCEWDLTELLNDLKVFTNESSIKCAVYQNYLGGGIAGRIVFAGIADGNRDLLDFSTSEKKSKIHDEIKKACIEFFYNLNGGGGDDYMVENVNTLEKNQKMSISGY